MIGVKVIIFPEWTEPRMRELGFLVPETGALIMTGYTSLAPFYHLLFPPSGVLKDFLRPWVEKCTCENLPWLEIGCGTGGLAQWLAENGVRVLGLDPDRSFVDEARHRIRPVEADIREGKMSDIGRFKKASGYGVATCLGNVVAHSSRTQEVRTFFDDTSDLLVPEGALIVQTVNFDRILAERTSKFPILRRKGPDGGSLVFERRYRFEELESTGRLIFDTTLRVGEGPPILNTTRLLPVRKDSLIEQSRPFFENVKVRGCFENSEWSIKSPATILILQSPRRRESRD